MNFWIFHHVKSNDTSMTITKLFEFHIWLGRGGGGQVYFGKQQSQKYRRKSCNHDEYCQQHRNQDGNRQLKNRNCKRYGWKKGQDSNRQGKFKLFREWTCFRYKQQVIEQLMYLDWILMARLKTKSHSNLLCNTTFMLNKSIKNIKYIYITNIKLQNIIAYFKMYF